VKVSLNLHIMKMMKTLKRSRWKKLKD